MASYVSVARTNYFRVKDETAFMTLMSRVIAEDSVNVFDNEDNGKKYAFTISGGFDLRTSVDSGCEDPEDLLEADAFYDELQSLLPDGEAVIVTTIGSEKPRYLVGSVTVVTNQKICSKNLHNIGIAVAREMLNNPNWETKNEC